MRLYGKFFAIHLKSAMAYPGSFLMSCLGRLLGTISVLLGVIILMTRFETIGGYALPEILLGYGVILTAFALAECFARGFDAFPRILREAQFDRLLVRPRGLVGQLICQDIRLESISIVLQGIAMILYGVLAGGILWTASKALVLVLMVACGAMLFFGLFLVYAALCFVTLEGLEVLNIFTYGVKEYSKYPFHIYGKGILMLLTFVVPMALVQYWPMLYLMGCRPGWYGLLPLAALLFLLPCCKLWHMGVRHYCSTGS